MITETQRNNLRTLSTYLKANTKRLDFDMSRFAEDYETGEEPTPQRMQEHPCGTAACAVGHGPVAGILPTEDENWNDYSDRAFGTDEVGVFAGLFSGNWQRVDNTALGAAERIDRYLETGELFYPDGERIS